MQAQTAGQIVRKQRWAALISARNQSGLTVKQWCQESGVEMRNYYRWQNKILEEQLETIESKGTARLTGIERGYVLYEHDASGSPEERLSTTQAKPVFAAFTLTQDKGADTAVTVTAVTVRIGGYKVEIQNNADTTLVEQVLRVVAKL